MVKSNVNCSIESEIKEYCQNLRMNFSRCLEFGIRFKAAEIEDCIYPTNLLSYKLERMAERLEEANRRIEALEANKIGGEKKYPENHYGN